MDKEKNAYELLFTEYPEIVSVSQMQTMLDIRRHAAYDFVGSDKIPTIKIGTSFRILKFNIIGFLLGEQKVIA